MTTFKKTTCFVLSLLLLSSGYKSATAQQFLIDLSMIDGIDITPDNLFNFQVQSLSKDPADAIIKGTIRYRNSDLSINYWFTTRLQPGINTFRKEKVNAQFQYSSGALKDLFRIYKVLPYGTYQYCVEIGMPNGEGSFGRNSECLYRQSEDQFMITLIDPENDAKLYEYNPQLTWVATYSFSSALTYRVRVAEIKDGQNTASAISRNNPIYQEKNLMQNSIVYPVYAKPLKPFQPYAWTVDAYYRGILLGGAEPWRFTIVEDTMIVTVEESKFYYEFQKHYGETSLNTVGVIKLKYVSNEKSDSLACRILNMDQTLKMVLPTVNVGYGDNLLNLDMTGKLQHRKRYQLQLRNIKGESYTVPFTFYNPLYVKSDD